MRRADGTERFGVLLIALLLFVLAVPVGTRGPFGVAILQVALAAVAVTAAWSVDALRRRSAVLAVALLVAFTISTVETGSRAHVAVALTAMTVFLIWVAWTVVVRLARERRVTTDSLWGAAVVYLLIGITFAIVYGIIAIASPGALADVAREPLTTPLTSRTAGSDFPRLLYFSLTTLSTLGYGDVTPTHDLVRMLAPLEAILGQLYLAIVIARMVALHLVGHGRGEGGSA